MTFDTTPHEHLIRAHIKKFRAYCHGALGRDDLMQVGRLAILHAHAKFDPSRGVKFDTYANYWVKQSLYRACSECGYPVRYPSNYWAEYKQKHGKRPGWAKSLDVPAGEDGDSRKDLIHDRARLVVDDEARLRQLAADEDALLADVLSEREADIVKGVFRGDTLVKSGERHAISRERARQLFDRSMRRVKESPRVAELECYLETP